jgi:acetyltransferase-like isoleucine patch superfamily enzyme
VNDRVTLALCRVLLALPDLRRLPPYWRALRRVRALALRRRSPAVDPAAVLHHGVYFHRGIVLRLEAGAQLRDRVRLGIDEPGLRAGSFTLGAGSVVLSDSHIDCSAAVAVGRGTQVGRRSQIFTHTHDTARRDVPVLDAPLRTAPVTIGDDVMLYNEVVVLPGVTIGDGAVVAVRAVVTRDVPPYAVVAGVPARVIGSRH